MCGIFGAFNVRKAAELCVIGLHGNQHRAIDYAGMVTSDGENMYRERGLGLARQVFTAAVLDRLHGKHALGHIRYPTVEDDPTRDNIQPMIGSYGGVPFALAHNGNLTNTPDLDRFLGNRTLATSMDSEYILRLIENHRTDNLMRDLGHVFRSLCGSFALCIMFPEKMVAACGPVGNRPLSVGTHNGSYFVSSETVAFGGVGAQYICDVEPGQMVILDESGMRKEWFALSPSVRKCRFEANYFSHPSSVVFGEAVDEYRKKLGRVLEEHCPAVGADIVTPVPDSSNFISMGYAESRRSGTYSPVIIRSHYVGRTFIAATQAKRDAEVAQKFSFSAASIKGKKIVVVDDSIVRGTTLPKIVVELRRYGAAEVHVRIGSPEIKFPCRYGINTPSREELISASMTPEEIGKKVGADSLAFLPLSVQKSLSAHADKFCFACMDGEYW